VNPKAPLLAATRAALEARYGLALEGVGNDQIELAVYGAGSSGMADPEEEEFLTRVLDRLPIDESWLFREDGLWEWLRDSTGPDLLKEAALGGRLLRVLSLGCSGGQEAFTAAMILEDVLERTGLPASSATAVLQVVGLDSSPGRIEAARSGVLPAWSVERSRPDWVRGRVKPEPGPVGRYRVAPAVQAVCRFEVGNLLEVADRGNAFLGGFDIVLCRHVLIYFRPAEAVRRAAQLAQALDPGAYLVFSAAEAHLIEAAGLEPLRQLGVGRARLRSSLASGNAGRRSPRGREFRSRRAEPGGAAIEPPRPPSGRPRAADPEAAVAAHVKLALEHAQAGRAGAALREARAALLHDPRHLYSRLLLGQHLIPVDERRGREVLRDLLEAASRLSPDAAVPCADGLSVGQLAEAARIILGRREGL